MEVSKIIPTHNGLVRLKTYTLEQIFKWIDDNPRRVFFEDGEYRIRMNRAIVFKKKGLTCVSCGVKGLYFALEQDKGGGIHLDLYGMLDESEEVLLTIDHIVPKSKGGLNKIINFQTMCKICNESKADEYEKI